jgi:hypothetical protein
MLKNYQDKFRERFLLVLLYKTNQKTRVTPRLAADGTISALKRPSLRR